MGAISERDNPERQADLAGVPEFRLVLTIAGALRAEFGDAIDAHPGGDGNEAGVVNRAFRAASAVVLGDTLLGDDPVAKVTWALHLAALQRLDEHGVPVAQAKSILDSEPALKDAWLAYLALAPAAVAEDLMGRLPVE